MSCKSWETLRNRDMVQVGGGGGGGHATGWLQYLSNKMVWILAPSLESQLPSHW